MHAHRRGMEKQHIALERQNMTYGKVPNQVAPLLATVRKDLVAAKSVALRRSTRQDLPVSESRAYPLVPSPREQEPGE